MIAPAIVVSVVGVIGKFWIESQFKQQQEVLKTHLSKVVMHDKNRYDSYLILQERIFACRAAQAGIYALTADQATVAVARVNEFRKANEELQAFVGSKKLLISDSIYAAVVKLIDRAAVEVESIRGVMGGADPAKREKLARNFEQYDEQLKTLQAMLEDEVKRLLDK